MKGKKTSFLPSLFTNNKQTPTKPSSWKWPSCKQPKTHSFRVDDMFKTVNSIYFDAAAGGTTATPESSWFTNSSESASFSTISDHCDSGGCNQLMEVVRGGLQSERLLFEPDRDTSSMLTETIGSGGGVGLSLLKESVVLAGMESTDPYEDFRRSMEEIVEAHALVFKDWECLEELLTWYLRVNGKNNHGFIVCAFVDLLVALASSSLVSSLEKDVIKKEEQG
ncbi:hypothetical protein GIB67_042086 [Kingdonia uniflora]|uniref:Transcription repressor n=1 Tax=Kingdonia uniflora TaxID=39325 RepID=A0A7J7MVS1_9MAGN|nr:hypothetical protein GIB67_042086 [Kingdonia uniflora]